MMEKALIIIGGNSTLISKFLKTELNIIYKKIIIISHRKYNGEANHEIIEFLDPKLLEITLNNIISNNLFDYDLIVSNTPPQNADFQNEKTREWAMVTLKVMNMFSFNHIIKKVIFTGSCLPLLPLYHESFYKKLKDIEMRYFIDLIFKNNKKHSYIILPPLRMNSDTKFNPIFDSYEKWALILREELGLNNSIVYPRGIVGFITKILFFIKFRTI
jgi:hypothetical protein